MEPITAFKTSDGKIFEDEKEAKKHQHYVDRYNYYWDLLNEIWYSGVDLDEVVKHLCENK